MKAITALVMLVSMLVPMLAHADRGVLREPRDARTVEHRVISVYEDPCADRVIDPIVTPVRDIELDAQRSACLRRELSVRILGHALIDTPGFYGSLGGNLAIGGRLALRDKLELSAQLRVGDYSFVQNAVNQATHLGVGPLVLGAAVGDWIAGSARAAIVVQAELPYTRDDMDTLHASGQLAGVVTGTLSRELFLHARLGALAMYAESVAGSQRWLALRAGVDLAWQLRTRLALQAGGEMSAGWYGGFDHVLLRAGVHWQMTRSDWRLRAGIGAPLGGSERTNAVLDLALVHGL
jgi:hypothetical protein